MFLMYRTDLLVKPFAFDCGDWQTSRNRLLFSHVSRTGAGTDFIMSASGNAGLVQMQDVAASVWSPLHVVGIQADLPQCPLITAADANPILPDQDLWDVWPLQLESGAIADIAGGQLWMILSAPRQPDPGARHDVARTRLLHRTTQGWRDCGLLFPDGLNPGSREWSGAARYDPATQRVIAYFTAAGCAGEVTSTFEQRLFQATGELVLTADGPRIKDWSAAHPLVHNSGLYYHDLSKDAGTPGNIRGFRDPYWLRDPADGKAYILFTGSLARSSSKYSGVVGLAVARDADGDAGFELLPPIISADGLANELERPHLLIIDGQYYIFWSSQKSIFAPTGPSGPTGLYGMVAPSLKGPYRPLNGTGLVLCNPVSEPKQAYCWQVLPNLDVISFVDHWGLAGRDPATDRALNRAQFGGTIAPIVKISINDDTTRVCAS
jgi:levansucrase